MHKETPLLEHMIRIARRAGDAIMEVYTSDDFGVETKHDGDFDSPLTQADKAAHDVIVGELAKLNGYDIVSEEGDNRKVKTELYWLVDPLDGTKEFVKRNGEFTVNIALMKANRPLLGVVYAPVLDVYYCGNVEHRKAFKIEKGERKDIFAEYTDDTPKVVVSRSHKDDQTQKLLNAIGRYNEVAMGSSLKLCLVAEGAASLYPRLGPTSLWDTAAADAVVTSAGGAVKNLDGSLLSYDPTTQILNPFFVVEPANNSIAWTDYLK